VNGATSAPTNRRQAANSGASSAQPTCSLTRPLWQAAQATLRRSPHDRHPLLALFVAAGFAEIGGGYLVWRWLRDGAGWWVGALGALVLVGYGVIPTLQENLSFGRVYAAYGGVFVVMSLLWGWGVDSVRPDRWDWLGALVILAGVAVIAFAPRHPS
jgi:small multidrug resistance family-3 protein